MTVSVYFHPDCLAHDPGPVPGFGPARLEAVRAALGKVPGLEWREAEPADKALLELVHTPPYIDDILTPITFGKERPFDSETFAMQHTGKAALRSAGLVVAATRAVVAGETQKAFCLVSPGGHHAEAGMAQGFCFFNHVAIAAVMAQQQLNVSRVAVFDFDAHHGNGTQSLFWSHENRLLISLHEDTRLSGFNGERGAYDNILNIQLPPGSDGAFFRQKVEEEALPKLAAFAPDLIFVSAGFDMHSGDPLSTLELELDDYAWIGVHLARMAKTLCGGRIVAVLEGGYDLEQIGPSAAAFVLGLMHG